MYKVAIITASDKGYAGEREDKSGSVIEEIVTAHELEVTGKVILPDDRQILSDQMLNYCHQGIDLILTTGGTGFSKRDVTPEATADIVERRADNLTFAMIANSLQYTPKAMLSRGIAGIRENTLIVNLPGSPKAVRENLEYAIDAIIHGVKILKVMTQNVPENKLNLLSYLQSNPLQINMPIKGMQNKPFNTFVFFIAYFASLF